MWWRSRNTEFYQPPNHPSITTMSCPSPGAIPSKIPADMQSSNKDIFNCFVVINAAQQRLGLNHTKQLRIPKKHCFQPLYLHKRNAFDGLVMVMVTQLISRMSMAPRWVTGANGPVLVNTHSVPCGATFCPITSANYWDFQ